MTINFNGQFLPTIFLILACNAFILTISNNAAAATTNMSIGLSGSGSQNNAGLEKQKSSSGSVNVSFGLGAHVKIGLNHRQATEHSEGLKQAESSYYKFQSDLQSSTYSLNLTLIIYSGRVSPYIFGGIANKYYTNKFTYNLDSPIIHKTNFELTEVPTYGFGVAIFLNREFSLKITQTFSPGKVITIDPSGQEKEAQAYDSYTQVGISYNVL